MKKRATTKAFEPPRTQRTRRNNKKGRMRSHQWYRILLMILGHKPETVVASRPAVKPDAFSLNIPVVKLTFTKMVHHVSRADGLHGQRPRHDVGRDPQPHRRRRHDAPGRPI